LFFGNRSTDSVIFLEELEGLKNRFLQRLSIHYLMTGEDPGYELLYGRIDQEKTKTLCSQLLDMEEVDEFFLCGPSPMIEAIRETLKEEKVPAEKVHFELFNTPANASGANKRANLLTDIKAEVTITLDGKTFSYQHPSVGETILDEARKKGGDLPFACKGGVCCTCKAKVLEGAVEMELNYGLVAEEVKIGYVLTCQAHPKTEKVVLSFDE
jgi:ring-1,2-phenylacetyl-CoA epoxidase subunit PaaE